jgi:Aerotolerance regulator N-terminal
MEMSLLHAGLAAGAALAAVPVILHLFMRQTPKHVIFPALRLVRERQKRSKKRMRIKNWLLLLARMALLALMALALARPTLYSQVPLGDQSVPTAMGLVFDTSLSMKYKDKDKTRLDEAKERAREIVQKLPDSSQVFVIDSAEPAAHGLSPAAALKRIDELSIHAVSRPLNGAMGEVYRRVAECDKPNRVVYVLTDLFKSAWNTDQPAEGLDQVEKLKKDKRGRLVTFVVRLTPQEVSNVSVDSAEPTQSIVTQGEPIEVRARVRSVSQGKEPATRTVEFFIDNVKKGQQIVQLPPKGGQKDVNFPVPSNLREGELHRGEIALKGVPDPLEDDDRRYFTFKVRPPMKVLVVSERPTDANFVVAALDPDTPSSPRSYVVNRKTTDQFQAREKDDLSEYSCIFLLNVARLDSGSWGALNAYVHQGGGLVVGAGHLCDPESYNGDIAAQFLPAQIERTGQQAETKFGKIADVTHPLFQKYGPDLDTQLSQVPVYRHWGVKDQAQPIEGTRTLVTYADGSPALLERTFKGPKTGRVLLWTTPLYRNPRGGPDAWNDFPYSGEGGGGWSFPVLIGYLTVPYMAGAAGDAFNFEAGQPVTLTLDPTVRYKTFSLTGPGPEGKTTDIPAPTTRDSLEVSVPQQQPGQWTVKAMADGDRSVALGFSLNPPHRESEFDLMEKPDLDAVFGKDGYHLAEDEESLKKEVAIAKTGHEIFPFLMFLILIVVTMESILANTFYKEAPRPSTAGAAA